MDVGIAGAPKRTFSEVKPTEWEVDDGRILLFHKYVLSETSEVENNIWWELLTFVSSQSASIFLKGVGHVPGPRMKLRLT